jgi:Holliday junction resolvase RusA-like endonuclease
MIDCFVAGLPAPQPRPRMCRNGHVYNPKTADAWKKAIKEQVFAHALKHDKDETFEGAVYVRMLFVLPRPKKHKNEMFVAVRPDLDNYVKAVLDALTDIRVWNDDGQVARLNAEKAYTHGGHAIGMHLEIKEIG